MMSAEDEIGPFALLSGAVPAMRLEPVHRAKLGYVLVSAQRTATERVPAAPTQLVLHGETTKRTHTQSNTRRRAPSSLYALVFCGGLPPPPASEQREDIFSLSL